MNDEPATVCPKAGRKRTVSLWLDSAVVEWFRETGPGWQTRINDELRKVAGL